MPPSVSSARSTAASAAPPAPPPLASASSVAGSQPTTDNDGSRVMKLEDKRGGWQLLSMTRLFCVTSRSDSR